MGVISAKLFAKVSVGRMLWDNFIARDLGISAADSAKR